MNLDCLIVANTNTSTDDRRKQSLTANSLRARLRHGFDVLRKRNYNPLGVLEYARQRRDMQQVLDQQCGLLIGDQPRGWCPTDVINYARAGQQVPVLTRENADQYITWLGDVTLNGVILLDYLSRNDLAGEVIQTFGFESDERIDQLLSEEPVCVVVSTTFITMDVILALKEIYDRVASRSPRSKVVVGSSTLHWYTDNYPELVPTVLDHCDIIINDAQGFGTLCRVVKALKRGEAIDSIPNIIYRRLARVRRTQREPEQIPLDEITPDWRRCLPRNYAGRVTVQTSQGCPFGCRFCDFRLMNRTDYKSIELLREELRTLKAIGVTRIDFVDDLFTFPEEKLRATCRMMLEERFDFSWFCLSRSSGLSEDSIRLMAEAGCEMVNIGMESADPTVLKIMNKQTTVPEAYKVVDAFSRHGVAVMTNLILGFPGETDESIGRTIEFLNTSAVDAYFLNLFQVGRGTVADTPKFREQHKLEGEYVNWRHMTGSSREMAQKIEGFIAQVSDDVLRVGGLEDMQMLMNNGYTREDMASLAPIMKGLAAWERGERIQPRDVAMSKALLGRLEESERERRGKPPRSPRPASLRPS